MGISWRKALMGLKKVTIAAIYSGDDKGTISF